MKTEDLSTLKINKLTQAQYDKALQEGRINENELYLTPDNIGANGLPENAEFNSVIAGNTYISSNEIYMGDPLCIGRNENGGYVITEEVGGTDKAKMTPTKISIENDEASTEITPAKVETPEVKTNSITFEDTEEGAKTYISPYSFSQTWGGRSILFEAESGCIEINTGYLGRVLIYGDGLGFYKNNMHYSLSFPQKSGTLATLEDLGDINSILDILNGEVV